MTPYNFYYFNGSRRWCQICNETQDLIMIIRLPWSAL